MRPPRPVGFSFGRNDEFGVVCADRLASGAPLKGAIGWVPLPITIGGPVPK